MPFEAKSQIPMACFMGDGIKNFKEHHGEEVIAKGLVADDNPWSLLVNFKTGTWTILIQQVKDVAMFCPLASGTNFKFVFPPEAIEGEKIRWMQRTH